MHAVLRLIAEDLRDYASGELRMTPAALRHLAGVLDDICDEAECGPATVERIESHRSSSE
jgi:hypothetical protein